ncbi:molybdate ABC transporter substrate-binding protein [Actinomadura alba]|uniref:Molybdate ABC transporter substrate-binding protein n=1 Tax=Actinomadura alba TaxID=406431 RepID=A0ABR7LH64_9ACTN|nr:molybdate ABC transporter substrate-binding protein [Actinomadura alba]MBC6464079.1 molybdate ABC transporter substrate-binding protein [Actinomadura alba]
MRRLTASLAVVLLVATGCGGASGPTTLTVLAASSLTDVFPELARAYQSSHENVELHFTFSGSQELAEQVKENTPADVLATADTTTMDELAEYVDRSSRRVIAYTSLTIAVAPGNPRRIRELADLARPGLRVVLAAQGVPAGRYSRQALAKAGVTVRPVSAEIDVRSVLTRVRTGEADAGVVYLTDLRSAGRAASSVPIPAAHNVTAAYPVSVVDDTDHEDASAAFVTWLGSAAAKSVLNEHGFTTP